MPLPGSVTRLCTAYRLEGSAWLGSATPNARAVTTKATPRDNVLGVFMEGISAASVDRGRHARRTHARSPRRCMTPCITALMREWKRFGVETDVVRRYSRGHAAWRARTAA